MCQITLAHLPIVKARREGHWEHGLKAQVRSKGMVRTAKGCKGRGWPNR